MLKGWLCGAGLVLLLEEEEAGGWDAKVLSPAALVTLEPGSGVCLCPELPSVNLDQDTSFFVVLLFAYLQNGSKELILVNSRVSLKPITQTTALHDEVKGELM